MRRRTGAYSSRSSRNSLEKRTIVLELSTAPANVLILRLARFLRRPPHRHRGCDPSTSSRCRDKITGFLIADSAAVHRKFTRKWRPQNLRSSDAHKFAQEKRTRGKPNMASKSLFESHPVLTL